MHAKPSEESSGGGNGAEGEFQDQDHVDFVGLEANLEAVKQLDPSLLVSAEEEEQV